MSVTRISSRAGDGTDPVRLATVMAELRPAVRDAFSRRRGPYTPELFLVRGEQGELVAAAVTQGRPHTAARTIVETWGRAGEDDEREAVLAVLGDARARPGVAAVRWSWPSERTDTAAMAAAAGFEPLPAPLASVPSTLGQLDGATLWLDGAGPTPMPYYGQTTDFTCGAVSLMMAIEHRDPGLVGTGPARLEENRVVELGIWRQATNMPACEPVGLGVAAAEIERAKPDGYRVEVHVSSDDPVLLDGFGDDAANWRAYLQRESWARAESIGLPVVRDWVQIAQIAERVSAGEKALLLIDEEPMHGESVPHWVLLHAVLGDIGVIQDPWVDATGGESWVDATALPIRLDDLDLMTRWQDPPVRGVVFLG